MFAILHVLGMFIAGLFKSRWRLEAENLLLRHQLRYRFKACAASASIVRARPGTAARDDADLAGSDRHGPCGSAADNPAVASCRLQNVLALEIPKVGRASKDRSWPS